MKCVKKKTKKLSKNIDHPEKKPEAVSITESHGNNKREHSLWGRLTGKAG